MRPGGVIEVLGGHVFEGSLRFVVLQDVLQRHGIRCPLKAGMEQNLRNAIICYVHDVEIVVHIETLVDLMGLPRNRFHKIVNNALPTQNEKLNVVQRLAGSAPLLVGSNDSNSRTFAGPTWASKVAFVCLMTFHSI